MIFFEEVSFSRANPKRACFIRTRAMSHVVGFCVMICTRVRVAHALKCFDGARVRDASSSFLELVFESIDVISSFDSNSRVLFFLLHVHLLRDALFIAVTCSLILLSSLHVAFQRFHARMVPLLTRITCSNSRARARLSNRLFFSLSFEI